MSINSFNNSTQQKYISAQNSSSIQNINKTKLFNKNLNDYGLQDKGNDKFLYSIENLSDKNKEIIIDSLEKCSENLSKDFANVKKSNGLLGSVWDSIKNFTKIGAGSDKTQKELDILKKEMTELKKTPDKLIASYNKVAEKEITNETLIEIINGKIQLKNLLKANNALNKYTESQKIVTGAVNGMREGISSVVSNIFSKDNQSISTNSQKSGKIYTEAKLQQELVKEGFKSNSLGEYKIIASDEYKQKVLQQYGEDAGNIIIQKTEEPITNLQNLLKFINIDDGKYSQYWQGNMQELSTYYNILKESPLLDNSDKISSGQWEAVMNTVKTKASKDVVDALDFYKGGSYEINSALSELKKNPNSVIDDKILKYIDSIYGYLETQQISESIHVYREEGYGVLNSVELSDGTTLKQALEKIDTNNKDDMNNLIEDVLNHDYIATQERFMSTSLLNLDDPIYGNNHAKIKWDIEVPAGTKGAFIEGAIIGKSSVLCDELEYLIQKDSKILINGIKYDDSLEQWIMSCKIIQ